MTTPSESAREDVATTIQERHAGLQITLCGAIVQGEDAVPSIVGAVQPPVTDPAGDVLVATGGGGADTDRWWFNEGLVVRAIPDGQGAPTHRRCWADAYGAPYWFLRE